MLIKGECLINKEQEENFTNSYDPPFCHVKRVAISWKPVTAYYDSNTFFLSFVRYKVEAQTADPMKIDKSNIQEVCPLLSLARVKPAKYRVDRMERGEGLFCERVESPKPEKNAVPNQNVQGDADKMCRTLAQVEEGAFPSCRGARKRILFPSIRLLIFPGTAPLLCVFCVFLLQQSMDYLRR